MATRKNEYKFKNEEDIVTFGVDKGLCTIGQLIEKDPTYIEWCINHWKWFKMSKKLHVKYQLEMEKKNQKNQINSLPLN